MLLLSSRELEPVRISPSDRFTHNSNAVVRPQPNVALVRDVRRYARRVVRMTATNQLVQRLSHPLDRLAQRPTIPQVKLRSFDYALAIVFGVVVFGLSFWHSIGVAHHNYAHFDKGLVGHPGSILALGYLCYASMRRARPADGLFIGAVAAAAWCTPVLSFGIGMRGPAEGWEIPLALAVFLAAGAVLGCLLSSLAWLAKLAWRGIRKRPAHDGRSRSTRWKPASRMTMALLVLSLASLLFDSFGWSMGRNLYHPLSWWWGDGQMWEGWIAIFAWERAFPVVTGGLACWALLRRKHWAGRASIAYLAVTAVLAFARFAAFRYIRVGDVPPFNPNEWPDLWTIDIGFSGFSQLDAVALVEACIRNVIATLGTVYIIRSRRFRDWLAPPRQSS